MRPFRLVAFAALALCSSPAFAADPVAADVASFHFSAPAAASRPVGLNAINGSVHATASTDGKLDVRVVVKKGDASALRVFTRDDAGGVAICLAYAEDSAADCTLDGMRHSHHDGHGREPEVDLVARVPAGVALTVRSTNGGVEALGIAGPVRAHTTNGSVHVEAQSIPEAETTNGDVDARFTAVPTSDVELHTTNGDVRATFAAGLDANVDAATINGDIDASFPLSISTPPGGWGPKTARGKVGKGAVRVRAATTNGSIDVKSGK